MEFHRTYILFFVGCFAGGNTIRDRVDGHHKPSTKSNSDFAFDNPYFRDPESNDAEQSGKGLYSFLHLF